MEAASDQMLLEQEFCSSVPPPRTALSALDTTSRSPPSVAATDQACAPMTLDVPSSGEDVVPASPASSEDRLDCFLDAIKKKLVSPLLPAPTRPAVQPSPSEVPQTQQFKTRQQ
jgi:hypothetical protein